LFEFDGLDVALTAPTGRAAKRMSEVTDRPAKTIHRLLEVEWDQNDKPVFNRNARNPLKENAVIVDELSMVDISLFAALMEALPIGCRLIMVGDADQLPPVGAGNVLHDLIASGLILLWN
jgi:exodeoxyribonuclease V alpha subunit